MLLCITSFCVHPDIRVLSKVCENSLNFYLSKRSGTVMLVHLECIYFVNIACSNNRTSRFQL
jgi:hypothetical protein